MSGIHPPGTRLYFEHFWRGRARPRVVVHGVRLAELAWEGGASDERAFAKGRVEPLWIAGDPWSLLVARVITGLRLGQYKGSLQDTLEGLYRGHAYDTLWPGPRFSVDARGWEARRFPLEAVRSRGALDAYTPYDTPLSTQTFAHGLAEIERMAAICQRAGITYVVANVPEHGFRFGREDGPERYRHYLEQLRIASERGGFTFVDVTEGRLESFEDDLLFSDYHHMRPKGARRFTRFLADALGPLLRHTEARP